MVDPNRKINILSKDQEQFLEDCDREYGNRFTMSDEEFMVYCRREIKPPPIVEPWQWDHDKNHFKSNFRGRGRGGGGGRGGRGRPDFRPDYRWDSGRSHNPNDHHHQQQHHHQNRNRDSSGPYNNARPPYNNERFS